MLFIGCPNRMFCILSGPIFWGEYESAVRNLKFIVAPIILGMVWCTFPKWAYITKSSHSTCYPTSICEENPNLQSVWSYFPCSIWYNGISKNSHQIICAKCCCSIWYQDQILEQTQDLESFFPYLARITWYGYSQCVSNKLLFGMNKLHRIMKILGDITEPKNWAVI